MHRGISHGIGLAFARDDFFLLLLVGTEDCGDGEDAAAGPRRHFEFREM